MDKTIRAVGYDGGSCTLHPGDSMCWDCPVVLDWHDPEKGTGKIELLFVLSLENKDGVLCPGGPLELVSKKFMPE
jgi:hypothetical protein